MLATSTMTSDSHCFVFYPKAEIWAMYGTCFQTEGIQVAHTQCLLAGSGAEGVQSTIIS